MAKKSKLPLWKQGLKVRQHYKRASLKTINKEWAKVSEKIKQQQEKGLKVSQKDIKKARALEKHYYGKRARKAKERGDIELYKQLQQLKKEKRMYGYDSQYIPLKRMTPTMTFCEYLEEKYGYLNDFEDNKDEYKMLAEETLAPLAQGAQYGFIDIETGRIVYMEDTNC